MPAAVRRAVTSVGLIFGLISAVLGCGAPPGEPVASGTTPSTTASAAPGSTASGGPGCCGPERITLVSGVGTLRVDNLPPFTFPAGATITLDSAPAGDAAGECRHVVVVPRGGFVAPHFELPALNRCGEIVERHCAGGDGDGAGLLWDGRGNPGTALTDVARTADTSDGVCDTTFTGGNCTSAPAGAANTLGRVETTARPAPGGGVRAAFDVPVHLRIWKDSVCRPSTSPGCCTAASYGDDSAENGEVTTFDLDLVLGLTTNRAEGRFGDLNGDGCFRTGSGFDNPGPNGPRTLTGMPAPGPCCVVGQPTTVVSVGTSFSGAPPYFDVGFQATIPATVAACGAPGSATCTLAPDCARLP